MLSVANLVHRLDSCDYTARRNTMADAANHTMAHESLPSPSSEDMETQEREAFDRLIRPDDSYTREGTYWADLPISQRVSFVASLDAREARSESTWLWNMFKTDPLSPISYYFKNAVLPGAGLGLEGSVVYSLPC